MLNGVPFYLFKLTTMAIIKTDIQKFEGEYYTPKIWVDAIHDKLKEIQPDYLDIPTLDPAAGTKGLTRDYPYNALISSTLNDNEADVVWDYLNDIEAPEAVKLIMDKGIEMKKFNFICNPPYATAGNNKRDDEAKTGVSFTKVRELIQKEKKYNCFGRNLCTQFLWRIIKFYEDNPEIEEGTVTWIAPLLMLSSSSFTKLRERLFSLFDFEYGFMIDAGEFDGIKKGSWSIGFVVFKLNRGKEKVNLDGGVVDLKTWIESDFKKIEIQYPKLSSPLNVKDTKLGTSMLKDCFAMSAFAANNVEKSQSSVYIISAGVTENFGSIGIHKVKFKDFISGFCARRLIESNPFNCKDEYMKPLSQKPSQIFKFDILENTEEGIVQVGEKEVYNLDGGEVVDIKKWLNADRKNLIKKDLPLLSSAIEVKEFGCGYGMDGIIGDMYYDNLTIWKNATAVALFTSPFSSAHNVFVTKSNFHKAIQGFCARRLISSNVWNEKDEYMKPSDNTLASEDYLQWSNDCLIYSLFDNQSFQSSLRQITYQGKQWDIKNEFFFMSKDEIKDLAVLNSNDKVLADLDLHNEERFVYEEIKRIREEGGFSQEALNLLDYMRYMVATTFPKRHESKPEHHFNSWDAGYSQLKLYMSKEELKEFKEFRTILADKLRPKVYYFGFLYDSNYPHWTDDIKFILEGEEGELYELVDDNGIVLTRGMLEKMIK